ncbi:hypothetical protein H4582DRAFT_2074932 [Lactarius indigo]|nr:hypothetical protein H4582DRAFT_2074932 [Lactarius indigo]
MSSPDIIFYTAKGSPFSQRVEIAFQEAKADVTRYEIDLQNKPEWYAERVNPTGKLPFVGPSHSSCSSSSRTCTPDSRLLPKDPVERARVRSFIDAASTRLPAPTAAFFHDGSPDAFIAALAEIQELLPPAAQFAVGNHFTIADAALAPFLGRWELRLRNDLGRFEEGTGLRVYDELFKSERFVRLQKYYANISSRESFKNSLDSEYILAIEKRRLGRQ